MHMMNQEFALAYSWLDLASKSRCVFLDTHDDPLKGHEQSFLPFQNGPMRLL